VRVRRPLGGKRQQGWNDRLVEFSLLLISQIRTDAVMQVTLPRPRTLSTHPLPHCKQ